MSELIFGVGSELLTEPNWWPGVWDALQIPFTAERTQSIPGPYGCPRLLYAETPLGYIYLSRSSGHTDFRLV